MRVVFLSTVVFFASVSAVLAASNYCPPEQINLTTDPNVRPSCKALAQSHPCVNSGDIFVKTSSGLIGGDPEIDVPEATKEKIFLPNGVGVVPAYKYLLVSDTTHSKLPKTILGILATRVMKTAGYDNLNIYRNGSNGQPELFGTVDFAHYLQALSDPRDATGDLLDWLALPNSTSFSDDAMRSLGSDEARKAFNYKTPSQISPTNDNDINWRISLRLSQTAGGISCIPFAIQDTYQVDSITMQVFAMDAPDDSTTTEFRLHH